MHTTRSTTRSAGQPHSNEGLRAICSYIDRRFASPLTVARLAAMAGISPFHFIRAFRTLTGMTPHQYVRSRRIARAQELLVTTPMPVTEICHAVGFQSLGSFSSTFRRLAGESPGAYRAARRKSPYIPACFVRMYRADK
jgi:transcriptional regulator GlxA family with amidase domain